MNDEEKKLFGLRGLELSKSLDIGKLIDDGVFKIKNGALQIGDSTRLPESLRTYIDDYHKAHNIDPSQFKGQPMGVPLKFPKEAFEKLKVKLNLDTNKS